MVAKDLRKTCALFFLFALALSSCSNETDLVIHQFDPKTGVPPYRWCTQIYFTDNMELVVDNQNSRILYRSQGLRQFTSTLIPLNHPHSILYNPFDKLFYVANTGNNHIIAFEDLDAPQPQASTSLLAGTKLIEPHDITLDPNTGWLYALNPHSTTIFRFKGIDKKESKLDLSAHLEYARALSFINGKLYVVGSSRGKIVEIINFEHGLFTVHQAPGKVKISAAGNWKRTGLVPNDIAYYHGYWYVSSYFCPTASLPGQDYNKNKLIRFKKWKQFAAGNWQDLSHLLPDKLVPYFFTVHDDSLYLTLFNHVRPGQGDCIYRLAFQ